jgi:hypothetical protein
MGRFVSEYLPAAPVAPFDAANNPVQGRFAGRAREIDWRRLPAPLGRSALWRRFHHKRWQYVGIAAADCFIGCAIVDVGWTNTAFAYVFDRKLGKVVSGLSCDGLPGLTARVADVPMAGAISRFSWRGASLSFAETAPGQFALRVTGPGGLVVDASLDGRQAAPWLFACGPVAGGAWHATHKSSALAVRGQAHAGGRRYLLDSAWASLDHSNGLLPRETQWCWASAHSPDIGFNLQSGYFAGHENALWLDGRLIALGAALFDFDVQRTHLPWNVRTDDGLLELTFRPEGERREDRNLIVAESRYVQPVGTFNGKVRASPQAPWRDVAGLLGVAEHHHSRW